ncbi:MAG: Transcriptional regulator, Crp/Fnr family, partial [uncultured Thermomicrobiales bacterium]
DLLRAAAARRGHARAALRQGRHDPHAERAGRRAVHRAAGPREGGAHRRGRTGGHPRGPRRGRALRRALAHRRAAALGARDRDGRHGAPRAAARGLPPLGGREPRDRLGADGRALAAAPAGGREDRGAGAAGRARPRRPAPARHGGGGRREQDREAPHAPDDRADDRGEPRDGVARDGRLPGPRLHHGREAGDHDREPRRADGARRAAAV